MAESTSGLDVMISWIASRSAHWPRTLTRKPRRPRYPETHEHRVAAAFGPAHDALERTIDLEGREAVGCREQAELPGALSGHHGARVRLSASQRQGQVAHAPVGPAALEVHGPHRPIPLPLALEGDLHIVHPTLGGESSRDPAPILVAPGTMVPGSQRRGRRDGGVLHRIHIQDVATDRRGLGNLARRRHPDAHRNPTHRNGGGENHGSTSRSGQESHLSSQARGDRIRDPNRHHGFLSAVPRR